MLTVIVPNYNHARWLPFSLRALVEQVPPPDELIFMDDGSTDDSVAVAQSLLEGVPFARIERNPHNMGCMATQNRALQMAKGDWILFSAADDCLLPGFIQHSLALLAQYPQAGLCSTLSLMIDESGTDLGVAGTSLPRRQAGYISPAQAARHLLWDDSWFMGNTVIYRRACLLEVGGFPPALAAMSDGFICRLLALRHGACFIPQPLAAWRQMEGGMAWSVAADWRKTRSISQQAQHLMTGPFKADFPAAYARRWPGRAVFGAINFAWRLRRKQAGNPWSRAMVGLLSCLVVGTAFLLLRPWDAIAVMRRRCGW